MLAMRAHPLNFIVGKSHVGVRRVEKI